MHRRPLSSAIHLTLNGFLFCYLMTSESSADFYRHMAHASSLSRLISISSFSFASVIFLIFSPPNWTQSNRKKYENYKKTETDKFSARWFETERSLRCWRMLVLYWGIAKRCRSLFIACPLFFSERSRHLSLFFSPERKQCQADKLSIIRFKSMKHKCQAMCTQRQLSSALTVCVAVKFFWFSISCYDKRNMARPLSDAVIRTS